MSDRIRHAAIYGPLDDFIAVEKDTPHEAREADGANTLAIVSSCHRIVRKDGSLSGARACAACLRAAIHGIQPRIPRA
jgi:hypothetical protein